MILSIVGDCQDTESILTMIAALPYIHITSRAADEWVDGNRVMKLTVEYDRRRAELEYLRRVAE